MGELESFCLLGGFAVTAKVESDHPMMLRKFIELPIPHAGIQRMSMKQHDRCPLPFFFKIDSGIAGDRNISRLHLLNILLYFACLSHPRDGVC
ncbi:MAG: hypothetical protein PHX91_06610 [Prevotella sp.]|nr:hypothetical protein [Prevotella sp.]